MIEGSAAIVIVVFQCVGSPPGSGCVGELNDTVRPEGGVAENAGVAVVKRSMNVWLDSPARTVLAVMAEALEAVATSNPVTTESTANRRRVFTRGNLVDDPRRAGLVEEPPRRGFFSGR